MLNCRYSKGFTFPELIISISVLLTIFAFASINLLRIVPDAGLAEASGIFMADVKAQQSAAMLGQSDGAVQIDYSVKLDTTGYTLYKGQVYSPSDPSNYTVQFPANVTASTSFTDSHITFAALSGEIKDFNIEANQVTFYGATGRSMVIKFNRLGNVYYVNKI
ncbi:type II secretion system GspH family protein [Patescibacteria group bacterium]|nr:type II secretion system GspH family protein [Patescibacteria group bacterium]